MYNSGLVDMQDERVVFVYHAGCWPCRWIWHSRLVWRSPLRRLAFIAYGKAVVDYAMYIMDGNCSSKLNLSIDDVLDFVILYSSVSFATMYSIPIRGQSSEPI